MFLTYKMGVINLFKGILIPNNGYVPVAFANTSVGTTHPPEVWFQEILSHCVYGTVCPVSLRGSVPGWVP